MDMGITASKDKRENGNVLFLILIAVVLFAVLSYAVTQSTRGGGNADSEQLEMKIAEFMQQATLIKTFTLRKYTLNTINQIAFDESAYNAGGTVYAAASATATGRTIGIFNPVEGIHKVYHPIVNSTANTENWAFQVRQTRHAGVELGTTAGDEILAAYDLTQLSCEEINKKLTGSTAIPEWSTFGASNNYTSALQRDGTFFTSNALKSIDIPNLPGCNKDPLSSWLVYFDILREN